MPSAKPRPERLGDDFLQGMSDKGLATIAQRVQERLVAVEQNTSGIEAVIHRGRVLVEIAVAILQFLELAVDPAKLFVDLGQFASA